MRQRLEAAAVWLGRHPIIVCVLLTLLASVRIVGTYTVFSHTVDEPAHLACGMQWLDQGIYAYEAQHPPLARAAAALGPWLDGGHSQGLDEKWAEGLAILGDGEHYTRTLTLARLGILPFFWIATLVVYLWARRGGGARAILAVLAFTSLPPVLAHAGLATTDMALTAMTGAAFLALVAWCENPGRGRALLAGTATGLAVLCKFSALAFIPVALLAAALASLALEPQPMAQRIAGLRRCVPTAGLALLALFLTVWAGYRFSYGVAPFAPIKLPFPELYQGIAEVIQHNRQGHYSSYLLGQRRTFGWWYYYFVVLAVKTPLAFLALLGCGLAVALRRTAERGLWLAAAFSFGILLFCTGSNINLGVRHILPVYLGFSVLAAAGALALWRRAQQFRPAGWLAGLLLLSLAAAPALAQPDYLAYFNPLAGPAPERFLVDSDLDWGQDLKRLSLRLRAAGASSVALTPTMPANLAALGFPRVVPNDFIHPQPGWNAMRLSLLQVIRANLKAEHPEIRIWPDYVAPSARIGKGILLWYFRPEDVAPKSSADTPQERKLDVKSD